MDRQQILHKFWSSFGYSAYEENSVPDDAVFPYITYEKIFANVYSPIVETASIWTRSESWSTADMILNGIYNELKHGGKTLPFDDGILWVSIPDTGPFSQTMDDEEDKEIKRYVLNVALHWLNE